MLIKSLHSFIFILSILLFPKISFSQAPDLGAATPFALFTAVGAFTNVGASVVVGDIGTDIGLFTGFPPGVVIGSVHVADVISGQAAADVDIAYNYLTGLTCGAVIGTTLGSGQLLTPNIYCLGAASNILGDLTLDAEGDPNALFIFQIDGALSTSTLAHVMLINGASACNVYWQVNGAFELGETSVFNGTLIAAGAISLYTGSTLIGRALSTSGALSISASFVTLNACCGTLLPTIDCPATVTISCTAEIPAPDPGSTSVTGSGPFTVVFVSDAVSNQTCDNRYTITRIYEVTDACNNTATCAQLILVDDQSAPAISTCPADTEVACTSAIPGVDFSNITTSDNCGGLVDITSADVISSQNCPNQYIIARTFTASDICGNTAACTQTITVNDLTPPIISTCPSNLALACENAVPGIDMSGITTSDNCGGLVEITNTDVISGQTCPNQYIITRTYTATDLCGNSAACTQVITVNDQVAPTITCPANTLVSCTNEVPLFNAGEAVTSDNCGGTVSITGLADVISGQTCPNRYLITRTYVATDICGNEASCNQILEVNDLAAPTIICPAAAQVSCTSLIPPANTNDVIASDLCGGVLTLTFLGDAISGQTCPNRYTITRSYGAIDLCGNSAVCNQTISVDDQTAPAITCPADALVSCENLVPIDNLADVTASDNCGGGVLVTFLGDAISAQNCTNQYTITRSYQAADDCGNLANCNQIITVNDQTPPLITCLSVISPIECPAIPNFTGVTASDLCDGTVLITFLDAFLPNGCPQAFTQMRTWTATDVCGNFATCIQTISVSDNTPPIITCPVVVSPVECPVTTLTFGDPIATDLCDDAPVISFNDSAIPGGICAQAFTLTRTWTATDACGNTAICSRTIDVIDNTAPVISCPVVISPVECPVIIAPFPPATAVDLCDVDPTITSSDVTLPSGLCAQEYAITRTWTATDNCGNMASCSRTILVTDNTPPTITCPLNLLVNCAIDVPIAAPSTLNATDLCSGSVTLSLLSNEITNQVCINQYSIARTYQAIDPCGNASSCTQIITVNDVIPPTINCLPSIAVACADNVPAPNPNDIPASDNCSGATTVLLVSNLISNQVCVNQFVLTRVYEATDDCGNTATCAQTITVLDNIPPVFSNPPAAVSVECFSIPPVASPIAFDNCTGLVTILFLGETETPGVCPILYTLLRSWSATDPCGNTTNISQLITVRDTYAPQFSQAAVDTVLACDLASNMESYQLWLENHGDAIVFDCGDITWTATESPFNLTPNECGETFQRFMRFTATDVCGNATFQDASFTIVDQTPPIFTLLPQNKEVECVENYGGEIELLDWIENLGYAEVSDNCGAVTSEFVFLSESKGCGNTFVRTYQFRATDECGNSNYVNATFSIVDTTPPIIDTCPPGNIFLTCEFTIPAPDISSVVAHDNCGSVTITLESTSSVGVGCAYWPMSKTYVYAATDDCGNVSNCFQSFQVVDSIPPVYTGQDTIYVNCAADLPGLGDAIDLLSPFMDDICYDIVCIASEVMQNDTNLVVFCVKAKDLCVNWTDKFNVTFIATGVCTPICSAPQTTWGNPTGTINNMGTTAVIEELLTQYGPIMVGTLGSSFTVVNADCVQSMLPGHGNTAPFSPGVTEFSSNNDCLPNSSLLNNDGTLINKLAANLIAMQLNMWYNLKFNNRYLGVQLLENLPTCMLDSVVMRNVDPAFLNIQGLINLSNNYLGRTMTYPMGFGVRLENMLANLNIYWLNCHTNNPCAGQVRGLFQMEDNLLNLVISPNPVQNIVTLNFEMPANGELQISIVGSSGIAYETTIAAVIGENALSFSTSHLPAGLYTILVQYGAMMHTMRMVKVVD